MRRVAATGPRLALATALSAASAALALVAFGPGVGLGVAAGLAGVAMAVPFFEWTRVPPALARALPGLVALVLLVTALFAWLSRSVGTLVLDPALFPQVAGPLLLPAALVFALAPRTFPVGRTLAPAIIGLLGVAGLNPSPAGYRGVALPFLKASEHSAFAERYLVLAVVVAVSLWTSALLESGPRWNRRVLGTLALSLLAAVALAATAVVGLPLLQPHIERAVASAFAEGTTGLGGRSRLGEFAELAVSRRRVLDLQTAVAVGPGGLEGPQAGPAAFLLPAEVLTRFDGHEWTTPAPAAGVPPAAAADLVSLRPAPVARPTTPLLEGIGAWFEVAPAPPEVVELQITQAEVESWPLLLPRGTLAVTADSWLLSIDRHGLLRRQPGDAPRLYGAVWSADPPATVRSADPREIAEALELPPRVDPRLSALAQQLLSSAAPDKRIDATVNHLRSVYRYTLEPGEFRTGDPLAEFLFEKKAGYCEYFATAAVILLRAQGIPARFVKGLSVGPQTDQGGGLHVVRESDAHAWVEAWVEGSGWVEFDPTPPGQLQESRPRASAVSRLAERLRAALVSAWTRLTRRGPVAFGRWLAGRLAAALEGAARSPLAWVVLAAVVLGRFVVRAALAWLRRPPPPPRDLADIAVPADLRALVQELERRWAAAGLARPPARGLHEHALRVAAQTAPAPPALAGVGPRIVSAYYRARFGGEALSATERAVLRAALESGLPS